MGGKTTMRQHVLQKKKSEPAGTSKAAGTRYVHLDSCFNLIAVWVLGLVARALPQLISLRVHPVMLTPTSVQWRSDW